MNLLRNQIKSIAFIVRLIPIKRGIAQCKQGIILPFRVEDQWVCLCPHSLYNGCVAGYGQRA